MPRVANIVGGAEGLKKGHIMVTLWIEHHAFYVERVQRLSIYPCLPCVPIYHCLLACLYPFSVAHLIMKDSCLEPHTMHNPHAPLPICPWPGVLTSCFFCHLPFFLPGFIPVPFATHKCHSCAQPAAHPEHRQPAPRGLLLSAVMGL